MDIYFKPGKVKNTFQESFEKIINCKASDQLWLNIYSPFKYSAAGRKDCRVQWDGAFFW